YAIETLLTGAKYHALAAATDFFQQFVIAQFSENLRQALTPRSPTCWFVHVTGVIDSVHRFARESFKCGFVETSWAASFWRVGWDFRPASWTKSDWAIHCRRVARALPLFYCVKVYQRLRPDH